MTKPNILILFFLHFMYISIHQHVLIMLLLSFIIAIVVNDFFLDGIFSSKFNLKNMNLVYTKKIFHEMNHPKLPNFKIVFFQIIKFFVISSNYMQPTIQNYPLIVLFSYLVYNQIDLWTVTTLVKSQNSEKKIQ